MNMSFEDVIFICKGVISSIIFGSYFIYYTKNLINENNKNNDNRMNELKIDYNNKINFLLQKIEILENKNIWQFFK